MNYSKMQDANMGNFEYVFIIFLLIYSIASFVNGYRQCRFNKNPFGECHLFIPLGAWVWGDALIFGLFWSITSLVFLITKDINLFFLIVSIFWTVRSVTEIIYWLNQQYSTIPRNLPENLLFKKIFHNDSIWFIYQIIWQCLTVVAIISSIYFADKWLN